MIIIVSCNENGCTEKIEYEQEAIKGHFRSRKQKGKKVVYLTCNREHTHRYVIDFEAIDNPGIATKSE